MVHDVMSVMPAPLILVLIGLAVAAESALLFGLVLPGSTMLLALGLATRLGEVPLSAAIPVAIGAAVVGGQLAYLRGRHHTSRARTSGRLHTTIERAEGMVARHGVWSIVVAQWIAGLRTFTPRLAGRAHVPYRTFGVTQIPVAAVWAATFVTLGHFAGVAMQQRIGTAATIAGVVLVAVGLIVYAVRRRGAGTAPVAVGAAAQAPAPALTPAPAPVAAPATATAPEPTGTSPDPVRVPVAATAAAARTPDHAAVRLEPLPGSWPVGPWMCFPR